MLYKFQIFKVNNNYIRTFDTFLLVQGLCLIWTEFSELEQELDLDVDVDNLSFCAIVNLLSVLFDFFVLFVLSESNLFELWISELKLLSEPEPEPKSEPEPETEIQPESEPEPKPEPEPEPEPEIQPEPEPKPETETEPKPETETEPEPEINCPQPIKLISIGNSAFDSCEKLKEFDFKKCGNLTSIGEKAFFKCKELEIDFSCLKNLDKLQADSINGIKNSIIDLNQTKITSINKLFDDKTTNDSLVTKLILPESIKEISKPDFLNLTKLTEIISLNTEGGITFNEGEIFKNNVNLKKIDLSKCKKIIFTGEPFLNLENSLEIDMSVVEELSIIKETFKRKNKCSTLMGTASRFFAKASKKYECSDSKIKIIVPEKYTLTIDEKEQTKLLKDDDCICVKHKEDEKNSNNTTPEKAEGLECLQNISVDVFENIANGNTDVEKKIESLNNKELLLKFNKEFVKYILSINGIDEFKVNDINLITKDGDKRIIDPILYHKLLNGKLYDDTWPKKNRLNEIEKSLFKPKEEESGEEEGSSKEEGSSDEEGSSGEEEENK